MTTENDVIAYLRKRHGIFLDRQQEAAVRSDARHLLLLAVPGSGKTTVLVSRIAQRLHTGQVRPERLLTLTFSREAARDMGRRFTALFGEWTEEVPRFSTIHSFCYRLLGEYAARYGRKRPKLLAGQGRRVLGAIYRQVNGEYPSDDMLDSLENDIGLVKNRMIPERELKDYEITAPRFAEILRQYEAAKRENGWMDFDDMLAFSLEILQKLPRFRAEVCGRYDEILVDEAQDVSRLQYELLFLLAGEKSVFLVGDEDQCIYAFRGACPEEMLSFSERYPDAEILKIETNYRCPADLAAAADALIRVNQNRYEKRMTACRAGEGSISVVELADYSEQYDAAMEMLRKETGSAAVLYRNNESVIPLLDRLEAEGIPYRCRERNSRSFFESFVVREISALFQLVLDPMDLPSFEQVSRLFYCSRGAVEFARRHLAEFGSVWEAAAFSPETAPYTRKRLLRAEEVLDALRKKPPRPALDWLEERLDYREWMQKRAGNGPNRISALLKMNILKTLAGRQRNIAGFLDTLEQLRTRLEQPQADPGQEGPALLTMHAGKGLEFDTVILLDVLDGVLPSPQAVTDWENGDRDAMEGEARLFYVAMTRARKRLVVFTSQFCNDEPATPSRFIFRMTGESRFWGETTAVQDCRAWKGKRVVHQIFGAGTVVRAGKQGDISVRFLDGMTKHFSVRRCIEGGMLTLAEEPPGVTDKHGRI